MAAGLSIAARKARTNRFFNTADYRLRVRGYADVQIVKERGNYTSLKGKTPEGKPFTYAIHWGTFSNGEAVGMTYIDFEGEATKPAWDCPERQAISNDASRRLNRKEVSTYWESRKAPYGWSSIDTSVED